MFGHLFGKLIEPPDPSKLTINYHDAESVLFAASILDQHGEWNRALDLYGHVLKHWPDEHGEYVRNSIAEIEKKHSLGGG